MNRSYTRVKICGIKDAATANTAVQAGADALGFIFAPGKRRISPEQAREICSMLPPFVFKVGVFVNAPAAEIRDIVDYAGLDAIQLHGEEPPEMCRMFRQKVIKAFRVGERLDKERLWRYRPDAFLFDTMSANLAGGTGKTFDWGILKTDIPGPFILAGGLNSENVLRAVSLVRPFAVDVSSGVETNGMKDHVKIVDFIRRVKGGEKIT